MIMRFVELGQLANGSVFSYLPILEVEIEVGASMKNEYEVSD